MPIIPIILNSKQAIKKYLKRCKKLKIAHADVTQLLVDSNGDTYFLADILALPANELEQISTIRFPDQNGTHYLLKDIKEIYRENEKMPSFIYNKALAKALSTVTLKKVKNKKMSLLSGGIYIPRDPLNSNVILEPYISIYGDTFEKAIIKPYLAKHNTNPVPPKEYLLSDVCLFPNNALSSLIELQLKLEVTTFSKKIDQATDESALNKIKNVLSEKIDDLNVLEDRINFNQKDAIAKAQESLLQAENNYKELLSSQNVQGFLKIFILLLGIFSLGIILGPIGLITNTIFLTITGFVILVASITTGVLIAPSAHPLTTIKSILTQRKILQKAKHDFQHRTPSLEEKNYMHEKETIERQKNIYCAHLEKAKNKIPTTITLLDDSDPNKRLYLSHLILIIKKAIDTYKDSSNEKNHKQRIDILLAQLNRCENRIEVLDFLITRLSNPDKKNSSVFFKDKNVSPFREGALATILLMHLGTDQLIRKWLFEDNINYENINSALKNAEGLKQFGQLTINLLIAKKEHLTSTYPVQFTKSYNKPF